MLRLGAVSFLNVQPLVWAFGQGMLPRGESPWRRVEIGAEVPRTLALQLRGGVFDVAIVPVFEYLLSPGYTILPGAAIATRGCVGSVTLFSHEPLDEVRVVELDPASLTSVHLLKVLLRERGQEVEYRESSPVAHRPGEPLPRATARLLIGDPAIAEAGRHPYAYDLGELWYALTGKPFVFAAWLSASPEHAGEMAQMLTEAKCLGVARLEEVAAQVAQRFGVTPEFALSYFRRNLCYDLGEAEVAGWKEFARLCAAHGLIARLPEWRFGAPVSGAIKLAPEALPPLNCSTDNTNRAR